MPLPSAASSSPALASSATLRHVLVVGGTGFVGSAICRSALRHGLSVSSLSRTGCSPYEGSGVRDEQQLEWTRRVRWCKGDVLDRDEQQWRTQLLPPVGTAPSASATATATATAGPAGATPATALPCVDAVVSCVGGFGSVAWMRRVNGDANCAVFEAARQCAQVRRVGFVSAFHYQLPAALQRGYMEGKMAAEASLAVLFPPTAATANSGGSGEEAAGGSAASLSSAAVVSQTGFIYGSRYLRSLGLHLPLQVIGAPLGWLTDNSVVRAIRHAPLLGPLLTPALLPPVSVDALSDAMIEALMDPSLTAGVHTLTVEDIRQVQCTKGS